MGVEFEDALAELDRKGRLRRLAPRQGADFASIDYLGLAEAPELRAAVADALARGVPVGAGGSRLLRGNHPEHTALEAEAASIFASQAALYMPSGFMANAAVFSTLPQRGDLVVHDALIHASAHDGMRAGRAERASVAHNDPAAFEEAIHRWRSAGGKGRPWLAVESLYSMDGDEGPLADLAAIAARHDGMLLVDEAHATGVMGPGGRGLGAGLHARPDVVTLHTCGKALGVGGALICASRGVVEFLVNRCRPFIYSTAPSPLMAATVRAALRLSEAADDRRAALAALVAHAGAEIERCCGIAVPRSHIMPVIVGAEADTVRLATALQERGHDIRAIRPPTVPEGTSRLRVSLTLNVDRAAVTALAEDMATESKRLGIPLGGVGTAKP